MKHTEMKEVIKYLGGLFPGQLTQEQAVYLSKTLTPFSKDAAIAAVNVHKAKFDKVSTAMLIEGCRAEERRSKDSSNNTRNEGSWADVRRRLQPQLIGKSDVEVCLRVHRQWLVCGGSSYEAQFMASCRQLLQSLGMSIADAPRYADTILLDVGSFRQVLDDLRNYPPVLVKQEVEVAA